MVASAVNEQSLFAFAIRMANDPTGREPAKGDAPLIYLSRGSAQPFVSTHDVAEL
jgi:hypothetical protein